MENKKYVIFLIEDIQMFSLSDHLIKTKGIKFESELTKEELIKKINESAKKEKV